MSSPATYDAHRGRFAFYQDSYWGGPHYRNPSSPTMGMASLYAYHHNRETDVITEVLAATVPSYLVPHAGERLSAFRARHDLASYLNIVAPIVDAYADAATASTTRDLGSLGPFMKNLNGQGRNWDAHMSEVARWTAVYGFVATLFDTPAVNPAANRAEEDAMGVGIRATIVHPPAIAWVDVDAEGNITEFAFVDQPYTSDLSTTSTQVVNLYRYTTKEWVKMTTSADLANGFLAQRDKLLQGEVTASGPLPRPGKVPVVFSFFREVTSSRWPLGVSLVADTSDIAREVYNTLSNVGDIHRKTAFPFLAIPQKSTTGALDPETKVEVGPDTAMGYPSDTGVPTWVQPSAEQTRELRDHAVFLMGAAYRMAGLEVSVEGTNEAQSGLAIQLKSRGFEGRCKRFAGNLEAYEHQSLTLTAAILATTANYALNYPKRFVLPDASEDLARAILLLQTIKDDLGPEGTLAAIRQALNASLSLSDEELTRMVDEVRAKLLGGPQGGGQGGPGVRPPGSGMVAGGGPGRPPGGPGMGGQ